MLEKISRLTLIQIIVYKWVMCSHFIIYAVSFNETFCYFIEVFVWMYISHVVVRKKDLSLFGEWASASIN